MHGFKLGLAPTPVLPGGAHPRDLPARRDAHFVVPPARAEEGVDVVLFGKPPLARARQSRSEKGSFDSLKRRWTFTHGHNNLPGRSGPSNPPSTNSRTPGTKGPPLRPSNLINLRPSSVLCLSPEAQCISTGYSYTRRWPDQLTSLHLRNIVWAKGAMVRPCTGT